MKKELNLGVLFTGRVDASFLSAVKGIQEKLNALDQSSKKASSATSSLGQSISASIPFLGSYLATLEKIIKAQMAWYGAKALLFAAVELPMSAISSIVRYAAEVDQAKAEMLRWGASSGTVTKEMIDQADDVVLAIRRASLEYPVAMKDLSKAMQAFVGAGVPMETVKQMVPMIAQLKTAFKEIDFEQFAVAVTGAFNTFRDQIKLGRDDAEKFQIIVEQMLRAQAVGVIRPEQFTKVLQYLGQVSQLAGFTTEQMFGMATAITNTGNQAANASRLMAGLMQAMSGSKFRKSVENDLGLKLDRSLSLAKQFDQLMTTIVAKMGKGEPIPLGWLEWVSGVTSADRSKIFMTFIQQFEKYGQLTKDIAGASGGLQAAADIMKMPLGEQWKLFLNVLHEIGLALTTGDTIAGLKTLMAVTLDIAKGFLAALDNGALFPDLFDKLGAAGKRTYEVITTLKNEIGALFTVLGYLIFPFTWLAEKLLKISGLVETLSAIIATRLILWAFAPLGRAILSVAGTLIAALIPSLFSALAVEGLVTTGTLTLTGALTAMMGTLGWVAVAVGVIVALYTAWNAETERLANQQEAFEKGLSHLSFKQLENRIEDTRIKINKLQTDTESVLIEGVEVKKKKDNQKEIAQLEKQLATMEERKGEMERSTAGKGEPKPGDKPPAEKTKDTRSASVAALKALQNAELSLEKAKYAEQHVYLKEALDLNLISEVEFAQKSYELFEEEKNKEVKLVKDTIAEIEAAYGVARGKEKDPAKQGLLKLQYDRDMAQENLKLFNIESGNRRRQEKLFYDEVQRMRRMELAEATYQQKLTTQQVSQNLENQKWALDQLGKDTEDRYANNKMTVNQFYDAQRQLIDLNEQFETAAAIASYDAWEKEWQKRRYQVGISDEKIQNLEDEKVIRFNENENKKTDIHNKATDKRLDKERQFANELQTIWDKDGAWGIIEKKMRDLYGKSDQAVVNFATLVEGTFKGLEGTLETVFFDALEGRCKSFKDYWVTFAKALNAALAKYLTTSVMDSVLNMNSNSGGGLLSQGISFLAGFLGGGTGGSTGYGGNIPADVGAPMLQSGGYHKGGIAGVTKPAFTMMLPAKMFESAPRYHKGLKNDEVAAVLKKRESVMTEDDVSAIKAGLMKPGYSYNVGPIVVSQDDQRLNSRIKSAIDKAVRNELARSM